MIKIKLFTLLIIIFSSNSFSQNLERLSQNRGFKEIKLGKNINEFDRFVKKDTTNLKYFGALGYNSDYAYDFIDTEYENIGNSNVKRIFIWVFDNEIYKIKIYFERSQEVIENLKIAYGEPTSEGSNKNLKSLIWKTEKERCWHMNVGEYSAIITYLDFEIEAKFERIKKANKTKKALSEF
ncbi:hypothetical protein [Lacinutrix jangbogonensis]|uniref:hypothetical protein n=1 Tax=Lacinutrix jangbogonensis TaxID=1469557 RepID=UPI00053DFD02|nr:hypothetical protein [Lacinutrix jangbogonensis]